ncbi:hypothetical protein A2U01_0070210, partial [Trifolium medium]|nr:hypothetical protein [Trifolium medium]
KLDCIILTHRLCLYSLVKLSNHLGRNSNTTTLLRPQKQPPPMAITNQVSIHTEF